MTNSCGSSFLCYRRSRVRDAELLVSAQHELGIPTWQDLEDLESGWTEDQLRTILEDEQRIANALVWVTPDLQKSPIITNVELPRIIDRERRQDGLFFAVVAAAGGLAYEEAARLARVPDRIDDLSNWNMHKVANNPITDEDARDVAETVLRHRLKRIHDQLPSTDPLRLYIYTRIRPPNVPDAALVLDWQHRFDKPTGYRVAHPGAWDICLMSALRTVRDAVQRHVPGRTLRAGGFAGLPAVTALGAAFLAQGGICVEWEQSTPGKPGQLWSLGSDRAPSGFISECRPQDAGGQELAVMVSINVDVEPAAALVIKNVRPRACVKVVRRSGAPGNVLANAAEAVDVAWTVVEGMRKARQDYGAAGTVHLFMAAPAGVAMMIGQLLNTFKMVQTYEYVQGTYQPAALLTPST